MRTGQQERGEGAGSCGETGIVGEGGPGSGEVDMRRRERVGGKRWSGEVEGGTQVLITTVEGYELFRGGIQEEKKVMC
jgi:hypothetical protein